MDNSVKIPDTEVLFEHRGCLGLITLNRPKALNALTHDMCLKMHRQLRDWADDDGVQTVCVTAAGEKAFCSGGDIRALYDSGKAGTPYVFQFYADEYQLNRYIKRYPKPYVALIDGIDMGGGVGVSVHGSHRVAGDRMLFAMPETGIGLFPDVGGSYFLPRLDGEVGMYLGLTGARLKAGDSCFTGIATHYVPSDRHGALIDGLAANPDADRVLEGHAAPAPEAPLKAHKAAIDDLFSHGSLEAIVEALQAEGSDWARETAKIILTKSPTSLKIAFRQIREGAKLGFEECMRMEYRITCRVMKGVDFYEGVRAVIIDKDQKPQWKPPLLNKVTARDVDAYFKPLPEDLVFE